MNAIIQFVLGHYVEILAAIGGLFLAFVMVLHAYLALLLVIPGDQGEAKVQGIIDTVQGWADFMMKLNRK